MNDALMTAASAVGCILAVDFTTGIMHWAEDTWLSLGQSALLDRWIVNDNIEHHRQPGKIREGSYWQTNRVCIALSLIVMGMLAFGHVHAWQAYAIVLMVSHSNQIHKWAHSSRVPRIVGWLQSIGLLQSREHHAKHHKTPYAKRFCTVTNFLNPVLDGIGFWRGLEWTIERCGITVKRATPARAGF
ncbi:MAG TPA: fatty acid desaturase CarF family protein [Verrucomicrobiae bacterium]|jgi:ubiquitin-conjugating enzyme E2 variant|nr:fatty acid desaturase CarF family protein [Verrucomicrobiae bacterium]